jgi:hypothetical protein
LYTTNKKLRMDTNRNSQKAGDPGEVHSEIAVEHKELILVHFAEDLGCSGPCNGAFTPAVFHQAHKVRHGRVTVAVLNSIPVVCMHCITWKVNKKEVPQGLADFHT